MQKNFNAQTENLSVKCDTDMNFLIFLDTTETCLCKKTLERPKQ